MNTTFSKDSQRQEQFDLLTEAVCKEFKHGEDGFLFCLGVWKRHLYEAESTDEFFSSLYEVEPPLASQKIFLKIIGSESSLVEMQKAYSDLKEHTRATAIAKVKKAYCCDEEFSCWKEYLLKY